MPITWLEKIKAAGLKEDDIIQSIDGSLLHSSTDCSERITRYKPGDDIKLTYQRKGDTATVSATMQIEDVAKAEKTEAKSDRALQEIYNRLGITFAPLTANIKQRFSLNEGVLISRCLRMVLLIRLAFPRYYYRFY